MFAKRSIQLLSAIMVVAALTTPIQPVNAQDSCSQYISGGPNNPAAGQLQDTAVVDGILLGLYLVNSPGGSYFVWVRCDNYQQVGDPIPLG